MGAPLKTTCLPVSDAAITQAAQLLRQGKVVAFPTETVYGLGADAYREDAVREIFAAKGRPQDNPLIVHVSSVDMVRMAARELSDAAQALMEAFWPGPLSIILKKQSAIPAAVSACLDTIAVRMPANDAARQMIERAGSPVAAPSANLSGRPSPTTAVHVWTDLAGRIPLILDGGPCSIGVESTVIDMSGGDAVILRPGDITLEQIRSVVPDAVLHDGVLAKGEIPASPGMKYRHYAPTARVYVNEGPADEVAKTIRERYYEDEENGLRPLILCPNEVVSLYEGMKVHSLGHGAKQCEQALFYELRLADEQNMDSIYFHFQDDMGLAVRNRIMKAAAWEPQEDKFT